MKPPGTLLIHVLRDHVLLGGVVAAILIPVMGLWGSLVFWGATVLVDVDHYLRFVYIARFKTLSIKRMFAFFEKVFLVRNHPDFLVLDLFHTVEFLAVFGCFGYWVMPALLPIFWGFLFHMVVDFFHLLRHNALTRRPYSILEYFLRRHAILKRGGSTKELFEKALLESESARSHANP